MGRCLPVFELPQVMNDDGHASTIKDKILTIDVQPGWKQGTKITFQKEGDQVPRCRGYAFESMAIVDCQVQAVVGGCFVN